MACTIYLDYKAKFFNVKVNNIITNDLLSVEIYIIKFLPIDV